VLIGTVAVAALMPQLVTPPAVVPGGRVILARDAVPAFGQPPVRIGAPLVAEDQAFWIAEPVEGDVVAVQASWSPSEGGPDCEVVAIPSITGTLWSFSAECPAGTELEGSAIFGPQGEPVAAPRSLARYLVSVDGERVIVNVAREIRAYGATPQPRVSPLGTP
ncbi:MAG: hypothetical protein ACRDGT_13910, partial [Candidatus Limnocylindria bacterium]